MDVPHSNLTGFSMTLHDPTRDLPLAARGAPTDARTLMLYEANKKSAGIAYLLWFFLGSLGGHRFYLGRTGSGVAMLILTAISVLLTAVVIGFVGLFIVAVWALVDAFLIPGWTRNHNNLLAHQLGA